MVARAFDKYLYNSEILGLIPKGTSAADSTIIVRNYIDNWIRKQVVLKKAEDNLTDEQKDVEDQLDDYRNSLISYTYEKELVRQRLDTIVSNEEVEKYYNQNQNNFELKNNIIKVIYLKLTRNSPRLAQVKEWYKSTKPADRKELENYCNQYAINYYLDEDSWLLFDDLLKEIPLKTYDKEQFLKNNRYIEMEDSSNIYLVNILGFKIKDNLSPLSFERDNIKSIILNKRKLKLIESMEKDAYEEAMKKKNFEIM